MFLRESFIHKYLRDFLSRVVFFFNLLWELLILITRVAFFFGIGSVLSECDCELILRTYT